MRYFVTQLKHVFRRLGRSPVFTAITLITLAIGIGANTAIFSVVDGVLLKPLPFRDPQSLVAVWHTAPGVNIKDLNASPSTYFTYREESHTFEDIALWTTSSMTVTGLAEPEQVPCLWVTERMLALLGVPPQIGRWFSPKDDEPGSPATVILTNAYWKSRFGGDWSVIGRRILMNGIAREVIGVMPERFRFLDRKPSVIMPLQFERSKVFVGNFSYQAVARLKPGITLQQANADVGRMIPMSFAKFPPPPGMTMKMMEDARIGPNVRPLERDVVGDIGKVLWVLMATIGVVLLIACANVANLLLVRAEGRQQELAIRVALGAGRTQIARELLLESLTLGVLGGALGLGFAYGALRLLVTMGPTRLPRLDEVSIDPPVLWFTLAVSLLAGLLFGLIPVFKYAGRQVAGAIRDGGRTLSQGRERHRARSILVVVQVALALVLLISSGLMIRTFQALKHVQPGFARPLEVQTLRISIPEAQVPDAERVVRMDQEILGKIGAIPGVSSVSFANSLTMDGNDSNDVLFVEDQPLSEGRIPPVCRFKFLSPNHFKTMGNPLVSGRDLTWTDTFNQTPVVLVSENLARERWGAPNAALGKRVRESPKSEWREIIGVVADERDNGVDQPAPQIVYWPVIMKEFWGNHMMVQRNLAFAIRSSRTGSDSFLKDVRQAVWSVNPNLPLANVRTLDEIYNMSMARTSFTLVMLAIAGAMALLLGVVGIYGVISYSVSQRTREIGIRMALGAREPELQRMFVLHGLRLTGIGVACGLAASIGLMRLLSSLLFGVSPIDPLTYAAVAAGLAAAAALASYLPARRATTVDPVEALRAE